MPKTATDQDGNTFDFEGDLTISGIEPSDEWKINTESTVNNTDSVDFIGEKSTRERER